MYILAKFFVPAVFFSHLNFNVSLSITLYIRNMKLIVLQFFAHSCHLFSLLQLIHLILYSGMFNNVFLLISAASLFV